MIERKKEIDKDVNKDDRDGNESVSMNTDFLFDTIANV